MMAHAISSAVALRHATHLGRVLRSPAMIPDEVCCSGQHPGGSRPAQSARPIGARVLSYGAGVTLPPVVPSSLRGPNQAGSIETASRHLARRQIMNVQAAGQTIAASHPAFSATDLSISRSKGTIVGFWIVTAIFCLQIGF